jgi:biopolymer transport protein ExbD
MRLDSGYEERRARIEMVPLIDCMFLLLVFFMYAMVSMTVHRGIRVTLPQGEARVQQKAPMIVSLTADNRLMIGDRTLELDETVREVTAQVRGTDMPVMINGDRASDLGLALELLSRLRAEGVESVSFLIEKKTP